MEIPMLIETVSTVACASVFIQIRFRKYFVCIAYSSMDINGTAVYCLKFLSKNPGRQ